MKTLMVGLVMVLAVALPARAQTPNDTAIHLVVASSLVAHAVDIATTMYILGARPHQFREANPLLRPLTPYPAEFGMAKMAVAVATNYWLLKGHAKHPKVAFWSGIASTALIGYVAHHNASEIRKLR